MVRSNRPALDQSVPQHAQHDPRHRSTRASARSNAPTCPSAAAPTRRSNRSARPGSTASTWQRPERTPPTGRPLLPCPLHSDVEPVRERALPGRLHDHHRPVGAAPRPCRGRNRVSAFADVPGQIRHRSKRPPARITPDDRADSGGRQSCRTGRLVGGRRGKMAATANEVYLVPLTVSVKSALAGPSAVLDGPSDRLAKTPVKSNAVPLARQLEL